MEGSAGFLVTIAGCVCVRAVKATGLSRDHQVQRIDVKGDGLIRDRRRIRGGSASAVRDLPPRRRGRERPPGAAAGPRSADDQGVAHALFWALALSPPALAGGRPRRPLSSPPLRDRSAGESLRARPIGRSARESGRCRGLRRSLRLRTTARTHVVPLFVLSLCSAATPLPAPLPQWTRS